MEIWVIKAEAYQWARLLSSAYSRTFKEMALREARERMERGERAILLVGLTQRFSGGNAFCRWLAKMGIPFLRFTCCPDCVEEGTEGVGVIDSMSLLGDQLASGMLPPEVLAMIDTVEHDLAVPVAR